jgi:hypothetical protein
LDDCPWAELPGWESPFLAFATRLDRHFLKKFVVECKNSEVGCVEWV